MESHRVIFVTKGKDSTTVNKFVNDFKSHGGNPEAVQIVTCDMGQSLRKGIKDDFKNSTAIIDKFHVIKQANEAVDATSKTEAKSNSLLKKKSTYG